MTKACPIKLVATLPQENCARKLRMSTKEMAVAKEQIQTLLEKKAIVKTVRSPGDFVSSIFLCPKKNGKMRTILDLKNFNNFAEKICFKMETLQHILHLIEPNFWMSSIDICDAFLGIPVLAAHQIYLKFEFNGEIMMYVCLPFGYTGSPRIFTKVLRPILARLRSLGYIVSFYLDD